MTWRYRGQARRNATYAQRFVPGRPRVVAGAQRATVTIGRSESEHHNTSRRRQYDHSHPEGPSPDGPGMHKCLRADSGPSGDRPSGGSRTDVPKPRSKRAHRTNARRGMNLNVRMHRKRYNHKKSEHRAPHKTSAASKPPRTQKGTSPPRTRSPSPFAPYPPSLTQ